MVGEPKLRAEECLLPLPLSLLTFGLGGWFLPREHIAAVTGMGSAGIVLEASE